MSRRGIAPVRLKKKITKREKIPGLGTRPSLEPENEEPSQDVPGVEDGQLTVHDPDGGVYNQTVDVTRKIANDGSPFAPELEDEDDTFEYDMTGLKLSRFSSEEMNRLQVVEITQPSKFASTSTSVGTHSVNSPLLGPELLEQECAQCHIPKCMGHYGIIRFFTPIYNPTCMPAIASLLTACCNHCGFLKLNPVALMDRGVYKLPRDKWLKKIVELSRTAKCSNSVMKELGGEVEPCIKFEGREYSKLEADRYEDIAYVDTGGSSKSQSLPVEEAERILTVITANGQQMEMGFDDDDQGRPYDFRKWIMREMLVIPRRYRADALVDGGVIVDPTTGYYDRIVNINEAGKVPEVASDPVKKANTARKLFKVVKDFLVSRETKRAMRGGQEPKSLATELKGKTNLVRNLFKKRVGDCGRSVSGPDPNIQYSWIGLPELLGNTITVDEKVTQMNIEFIRSLLQGPEKVITHYDRKIKGRLTRRGRRLNYGDLVKYSVTSNSSYEPQIGDIIHRKIGYGDIVLYHRYPTTAKFNLRAGRTILRPGKKNYGLNPLDHGPMRGDNDGDEIGTFAPKGEMARAEVWFLISGEANTLCALRPGLTTGLITQQKLGFSLLSRPETRISAEMFQELTARMYRERLYLDAESLDIRLQKYGVSPLSGRALLSAVFPATFTYQEEYGKAPLVREGIVLGTMTGKQIGTGGKDMRGYSSIGQALAFEYGQEEAAAILDDLQRIALRWVQDYQQVSYGWDDCIDVRDFDRKLLPADVDRLHNRIDILQTPLLDVAQERDREIYVRKLRDLIHDTGLLIAFPVLERQEAFQKIRRRFLDGLDGYLNFLHRSPEDKMKILTEMDDLYRESFRNAVARPNPHRLGWTYEKLERARIETEKFAEMERDTEDAERLYRKKFMEPIDKLKNTREEDLKYITGYSRVFVETGTKGNAGTLAEAREGVGQQYFGDKRPEATLSDRTRCTVFDAKGSSRLEARGLCTRSRYEGTDPVEMIFQAQTGRRANLDNAGVADINTIFRKILESLKDITIYYDGTVRSTTGKIIESLFAGDGWATEMTIEYQMPEGYLEAPYNIDRLITQINNRHGWFAKEDPLRKFLEQKQYELLQRDDRLFPLPPLAEIQEQEYTRLIREISVKRQTLRNLLEGQGPAPEGEDIVEYERTKTEAVKEAPARATLARRIEEDLSHDLAEIYQQATGIAETLETIPERKHLRRIRDIPISPGGRLPTSSEAWLVLNLIYGTLGKGEVPDEFDGEVEKSRLVELAKWVSSRADLLTLERQAQQRLEELLRKAKAQEEAGKAKRSRDVKEIENLRIQIKEYQDTLTKQEKEKEFLRNDLYRLGLERILQPKLTPEQIGQLRAEALHIQDNPDSILIKALQDRVDELKILRAMRQLPIQRTPVDLRQKLAQLEAQLPLSREEQQKLRQNRDQLKKLQQEITELQSRPTLTSEEQQVLASDQDQALRTQREIAQVEPRERIVLSGGELQRLKYKREELLKIQRQLADPERRTESQAKILRATRDGKKTSPYMTRYEFAKVVGIRAEQIASNYAPILSDEELGIIPGQPPPKPVDIAAREVSSGKLEFEINRILNPRGETETWRSDELIIFQPRFATMMGRRKFRGRYRD